MAGWVDRKKKIVKNHFFIDKITSVEWFIVSCRDGDFVRTISGLKTQIHERIGKNIHSTND
jgi:hypothetical protein